MRAKISSKQIHPVAWIENSYERGWVESDLIRPSLSGSNYFSCLENDRCVRTSVVTLMALGGTQESLMEFSPTIGEYFPRGWGSEAVINELATPSAKRCLPPPYSGTPRAKQCVRQWVTAI